MSRILIPRSDSISAKIIEPSDFEKYFSSDIVKDYRKTGMVITAGAGLSVNISAGVIRLKGLYLESDATENVASLTASAVGYIYVTLARDSNSEAESWSFVKSASGTTPADSFALGTIVCDGSSVTTVNQTTVVDNPLIINTEDNAVVTPKSVAIGDYTTPSAVTASSSATSFAVANIKDDNTSTVWKTDSENNPNVYADMGSTYNLCALAWYHNTATTETTIKIQSSANASAWTDERTILTSNLVANVYNYIRFNAVNARYLRVYGTGNSKILASAEMKVQTQTDNQLLTSHGHLSVSNSDTGIELDGTA